MTLRFYDVAPTPAPRQVQRDKWKPSPAVERYRAFRDEVALKIPDLPTGFFHAVFLMPMPPSWSVKKRVRQVGLPHLQKPDKDNLEKALVDAVYRHGDDAHVWTTASTKIWSGLPGILVSDTYLGLEGPVVDLDALVSAAVDRYDRPIV